MIDIVFPSSVSNLEFSTSIVLEGVRGAKDQNQKRKCTTSIIQEQSTFSLLVSTNDWLLHSRFLSTMLHRKVHERNSQFDSWCGGSGEFFGLSLISYHMQRILLGYVVHVR